jgi:beta-RFAP synthase
MPEDLISIDDKLPRTVEVTAPSRLHFGLLSFGNTDRRRFGGAGVMLATPNCRVSIRAAGQFEVSGCQSTRARQFALRWAETADRPGELRCRIDVLAAPPCHVGLGSGTQLALATAAGLDCFFELPTKTAEQLATCVGRGLRSAVGTHGFLRGGFVAEPGKAVGEALAPLGQRLSVPDAWRFVLIRPTDRLGRHGEAERSAFTKLQPVPAEKTEILELELQERMVPALERQDCEAFGESVYRYGVLAGECFAACQGGPFASSRLAAIVGRVRALGVAGVGQSSWGPTLFAILPDDCQARKLVDQLASELESTVKLQVVAPNNRGVNVSVV